MRNSRKTHLDTTPGLVFKDRLTCAFSSPGLINVGTSGTTISEPVICTSAYRPCHT